VLIGHHKTRISGKHRTAVPAKYRQELGQKVVLAQWYENCLVIVSEKQWQSLLSQVAEKPFIASPARETDRFLLGNAFEVELDSQGRFVIPKGLAKYANLGEEIIFVGLLNRVEIWSEDSWEKHQKYLEKNAADIAEQLGNVGKKKDE